MRPEDLIPLVDASVASLGLPGTASGFLFARVAGNWRLIHEAGVPFDDHEWLLREIDAAEGERSVARACSENGVQRLAVTYLRAGGAIAGAVAFLVDTSSLQRVIDVLSAYTSGAATPREVAAPPTPIADTVDALFVRSVQSVGGRTDRMNAEERLVILAELERLGVFAVKGALERIAQHFAVSRHTLYSQLQQLRSGIEPSDMSASDEVAEPFGASIRWDEVVRPG